MQPQPGNAPRSPSRPLLRRVFWYRERLQRGGFTIDEAASELEVSERTFYRDMDYLRTLPWDVEYSQAERRWLLSEEQRKSGTPLPLVKLREGEMVALLVAEEALRAYSGTPYAAALHQAFQKLLPLLDEPVTIAASDLPLPRFTGPPVREVEMRQFEQICNFCRRRQRIELTYYVSHRDEVTVRVVEPHHVFAYSGDWYVAAFDHSRGDWRTFALGTRIRAVRVLGETYEPRPEFDLDRYLEEGFGIFRGGTVEEVVLRFTPRAAPYLRERVWDETEEKKDQPDGGLLLRMRVPLNFGLLRFVLQYGPEVEVVEPQSLRRQVIEQAEEMRRIYLPHSAD